jgi:hypothetical protein
MHKTPIFGAADRRRVRPIRHGAVRIAAGAAALSLLLALAPVSTALAEAFKVDASTLNVRNAPKNGSVVGKLEDGEIVEVYEIDDGWARLSRDGEKPRWVSANYLLPTKAPEAPSGTDPRIASAAIPEPGQYGLSESDVEMLRAGAIQLLDDGRCQKVVYTAKSLTKENTYFFNCGDQSFFLTPQDIGN